MSLTSVTFSRRRVLLISLLLTFMSRFIRSFAWIPVPVGKSSGRRLARIDPRLRCQSWSSPVLLSFSTGSTRLYSSSADDASFSDNKKRLVFLGTPEVAATTLEALYEASQQPESNFEIVSVVTQPAKRRRRKGKLEPSAVGKVAETLGLPVLTPERAKDTDFLDSLEQEIKPDLCITAAYGQYLPKRFLAAPKYGTANIHPSLLPRWRGASPVQRSLEAGENPVGVTVLYTVSKMDAGPIIAQVEQEINENDTATTVLPMLFEVGTKLLLDVLPDILDGETMTMEKATPQDENLATAANLIHSSEAELKVWEESARTCHNRLRGFSMWPQTFMWFKVGDRPDPFKVKVTQTRVVDGTTAEPTDVVKLGPTKKDGLYVVCGDGSILELLQVQPVTRKAFPARDFQNGYPGETLRWIKTPEPESSD